MYRLINIVAIALFIIMAVIFIKYKMVCEITVNGEKLGYVTNKEEFEQSVSEIINKEEKNKLYTTIANMPEYKVMLVDKSEETNEEKILAKIEGDSETTYKLYAVTVDGKKKVTVDNLEEAEKLVKDLNKKYEKKLKTKIGVVEVITTNNTKGVTTIKKAKSSITKKLDSEVEKLEEKTTSLNSYSYASSNSTTSSKKTTATTSTSTKKTATASTKKTTSTSTKKTAKTSKKSTSSKKTTKVASLNGVKLTVTPVSGVITSRFGSVESIRDHVHAGLDIGAPKGKAIKAAASGTVVYAGYCGGYGNYIKISHGNGIQTCYGHCSKIYVKKGQKVSAGDKIAAVGSTGNSTGNHLHFEVVKNGTKLNPQNYLYK